MRTPGLDRILGCPSPIKIEKVDSTANGVGIFPEVLILTIYAIITLVARSVFVYAAQTTNSVTSSSNLRIANLKRKAKVLRFISSLDRFLLNGSDVLLVFCLVWIILALAFRCSSTTYYFHLVTEFGFLSTVSHLLILTTLPNYLKSHTKANFLRKCGTALLIALPIFTSFGAYSRDRAAYSEFRRRWTVFLIGVVYEYEGLSTSLPLENDDPILEVPSFSSPLTRILFVLKIIQATIITPGYTVYSYLSALHFSEHAQIYQLYGTTHGHNQRKFLNAYSIILFLILVCSAIVPFLPFFRVVPWHCTRSRIHISKAESKTGRRSDGAVRDPRAYEQDRAEGTSVAAIASGGVQPECEWSSRSARASVTNIALEPPTSLQHPKPLASRITHALADPTGFFFHNPIPLGHTRFKWTCSHCQRTFTETVCELVPGACNEWIDAVANCQRRNRGEARPLSVISNVNGASESGSLTKPTGAPRESLHAKEPFPAPKTDSNTTTNITAASMKKKYLLLGLHKNRDIARLVQDDLTNKNMDEDLFNSLNEQYNAMKRWRWLRFSRLSHIEWKQVHLYHSDRIAIDSKAAEDWPRCGRRSCATGCQHATEYVYSPYPARMDPPIPRQALKHFFEYPSHAGTKTFHYQIVPKREETLTLGPEDSYKAGWGFVFQETVSWEKIAWVEGVIGLGSLAFAVGWSEKHSIQDAFAPSAWMLAAGAIIMTLMYQYE